MNNNIIIGFLIFVLAVLMVFGVYNYYSANRPIQPEITNPAMDAFAMCVGKKATMYGAEWCTHCKAEKARFGLSWKYIPYVECPDNTKICIDKGIQGYPTWILSDGTKLEGEQGIEGIGKATGCVLGENSSTPATTTVN